MLLNEQQTASIVGEAVAGESAQVRTELETLIATEEKNRFSIGELLNRIKKRGLYSQWGFNTFEEYASTLKIKRSTRYRLLRIADVMEAVGITRERYEPVGLKKLAAISSLDPTATWTNPETQEQTPMKEFIVGFLDKADELSFEEISQHVRTLLGRTGENDIVFLNLALTRIVLDNTVRPAFDLAKAQIGSVGKDDDGNSKDASDSAALESIAADFLSDPANQYHAEEKG